MRVKNPFAINNWNFQSHAFLIVSAILAWAGIVLLEIESVFSFPPIRVILSGFLLLYVPGSMILRILGVHSLKTERNFLLTIALSITYCMLFFAMISETRPLFDISSPLTLEYCAPSFIVSIAFLSFAAYKKDGSFSFVEPMIDLRISKTMLFILLTLITTIFGTIVMNQYDDNRILLLSIFLIALGFIITIINKNITRSEYFISVYFFSLALLLHTALISDYLWGWDVNVEYFYSNMVLADSFWDPSLHSNVNAMLSVVMLAPILSIFSDLNLIWVFKIIYPCLFALVPLAMYSMLSSQIGNKISYLAILYFISFYTFYQEMVQLARQEIAEIFLVLFVLVLIDNDLSKRNKTILGMAFFFSLVISHYATTYLFLMAMVLLLFLVLYYNIIDRIGLFLTGDKSKFHIWKNNVFSNFSYPYLLPIFFVFALIWYFFISDSSILSTIIWIGKKIGGSMITDLFSSDGSQTIGIASAHTTTFLKTVAKYLYLLFQVLLVLGVYISFTNRSKRKLANEYRQIAVVCLLILLVSIVVPYFASSLNLSRIYHLTLIFLCPYIFIGSEYLFDLTNRHIKFIKQDNNKNMLINFVMIVFIVSVLFFSTGWVYEVTGESTTSVSLTKDFDQPIFSTSEVFSAKWITSLENGKYIFADNYRANLIRGFADTSHVKDTDDSNLMEEGTYVFLGHWNIYHGVGYDYADGDHDCIYNNAQSKVMIRTA